MSNLFLTIFGISIACSIMILIVMLFDKIFHTGYSRKWKYIIWAVIAIRLCIPFNIPLLDLSLPTPFLQSDTRTSKEALPSNTGSSLENGGPADSYDVSIKEGSSSSDQEMPDETEISTSKESFPSDSTSFIPLDKETGSRSLIPLYTILSGVAIVWFAGVYVYLSYHLLAYQHFQKRNKRWGVLVTEVEMLSLLGELRKELGIKSQITLMKSKQVNSPILVGFVRPTIILPDAEFSKEQTSLIIKHELIHYKHRDLYYKILLLIATALHWFNPLIHFMAFHANNDMELYCDEILIAHGDTAYRATYSLTLLSVMKGNDRTNNFLLSTSFSGKKEQVKNRFLQIMNAKPTRKGTSLIACLICTLLIISNLVACTIPTKESKAEELSSSQASLLDTSTTTLAQEAIKETLKETSSLLENTSNILILGIDRNELESTERSDSILVVSINPATGKLTLTSFLRDMYLNIPGQGMNKLGAAFSLGGTDLIKETLEANFDFKIDNILAVQMEGFENILDKIGGVEVELTKEEADYLNSTNYISKKSNRNVIPGVQVLNGNQALGYVRIRKVPTALGESADSGRTARLRSLLSTVIKKSLDMDISEIVNLLSVTLPNIVTDMTYDQVLTYVNTVLQKDISMNSIMIPAEGTFTSDVVDGMSVIIPDIEACKKLLEWK
ncbi:MAG TPA: M56 family metallopeptidase [Lachnospiraceae bacterium]|nr:M56 family metallopeptidase [Lachnospiraceae bacterium]